MKIIYFGTPEVATIPLQHLIESDVEVVAVVTQPDKPVGRNKKVSPTPVKKLAEASGIKVFQPENLKSDVSLKGLKELEADVFVVFAYGKIIPQSVLDIPKVGTLNIHPSLLPKYRGPSPVQSAILDQAKETGVTIIEVDRDMDHGPILAQSKTLISADDTTPDLLEKLVIMGSNLLIQNIGVHAEGKAKLLNQDHTQATLTKMVKKGDGQINWSDSAEQIYAQFRAYHPWPGVYTIYKDKRLKIGKMSLPNSDFTGSGVPGSVILNDNGIIHITCSTGAVELLEVQVEGKSAMPVADFVRGNKDFSKSVLGS